MTIVLMDLVNSLSGKTLSLKPEKPPEAGGCHLKQEKIWNQKMNINVMTVVEFHSEAVEILYIFIPE